MSREELTTRVYRFHRAIPDPGHYSSAIVLDGPGDLHRHLAVKHNVGTDVNYPALMLLGRQRANGVCESNCRGKIGTNIKGTERRACGACFHELLQKGRPVVVAKLTPTVAICHRSQRFPNPCQLTMGETPTCTNPTPPELQPVGNTTGENILKRMRDGRRRLESIIPSNE
ncbi:hypothetical protein PISMIDRAFT_174432 [Pisolithus microcarpus 441]|uniref:Uncharacterized protein n=1 Tax=Pisolithus microcarpus 441 TaxID=765257 RepID=A0A0C9YQP2_9AGAM|nr:hypothetical protein PISMIDRAFT_174432 [Pisolithus microcarpus 441]